MKNIVLIGMMGAGKTLIGNNLSKELSLYTFIDLDEKIKNDTKMKISEIFENYGEKYFRKIEQDEINNLMKTNFQIISLGGGAFEDKKNQKILKKNATVIYLKTSPLELFERIHKTKHRPLLTDRESFFKLFLMREKNYEQAHFIIDTTQKTPYNIVKEILERLKDYE